MARPIREVMTMNPAVLPSTASVMEAARIMRERNIGDILIYSGDKLQGILTDRDIVVRALAEGRDPNTTSAGTICSKELATIAPESTAEDTIRVMRERALRRIPVVEQGRAVGIVSLGDLAVERDRGSVLGAVSSAPPNR